MAKAMAFGPRSTADQVLAGIDLSGKRIVVTGCNSGMGLELMSALAANGAHVQGLSRTMESARQACAAVAYQCTPLACDLGDLESIGAAVATLRQDSAPIDVIVANAGIAHLPTLHTRYGVELQFLVNHIGHFAVINALADRLREGSGRVVIVSGRASLSAAPAEGIMFDNLAGQRFYDPSVFYGQSKLANALYAVELSRRLGSRGISVNAADPGSVRGTRLTQHQPLASRVLHALASPFLKSAAQGAATAALLAAHPAAGGISGGYWSDCRAAGNLSPFLRDEALAARLWEISEQIIECRSAAPATGGAKGAAVYRAA